MTPRGTRGTIVVATDGTRTSSSWWEMLRVQGHSVVLSGSVVATGELVVLTIARGTPSASSKELFIELDSRVRAGAKLVDARAWRLPADDDDEARSTTTVRT